MRSSVRNVIYGDEIQRLRGSGIRVEVVRTFEELDKLRDQFIKGNKGFKIPFLFVIGQNGTSKSVHFLGHEGAVDITTASSPVGLYARIYKATYAIARKRVLEMDVDPMVRDGMISDMREEIDTPIILDDVDSLLDTRGATSILKALAQHRHDEEIQRKLVSWEKQNNQLKGDGIPLSYFCNVRLCILCNQLPKLSKDFKAVCDRAKFVIFAPTPETVHQYVKTWWFKEHMDVFKFMEANLDLIVEPSIRWYNDALREKRLGNDWKAWLMKVWYDENPFLTLVGQLRRKDANSKKFLLTRKQQETEFVKRTGLGKSSYQNYVVDYDTKRGEFGFPQLLDTSEGTVKMTERKETVAV